MLFQMDSEGSYLKLKLCSVINKCCLLKNKTSSKYFHTHIYTDTIALILLLIILEISCFKLQKLQNISKVPLQQ